MSKYSESLDNYAMSIDPLEDDYEEKLKEVAGTFRCFNDALTAFIVLHGFEGDENSSKEKVDFLIKKFKDAKIDKPRNIKDWFDLKDWKNRKTAFKICFALNLDVDQTNDFFRRVQFERSFDCHTINEAVYYYCIKNKLKYSDAERIILKIDENANIKKDKCIPETDVLYTSSIVHEINNIATEDQLINYILENIENFYYNNATAILFIKNLWKKISGPDGLAKKEGEYIESQLNTMTYDSESIHEKFILEKYIVSNNDSSAWTIYSQIVGLDKQQESKYSATRSLSSVFSKNVLLPLKASSCFPSSQMLNSILRGELGDNERYRKMIILLVFYSYWAKKTIEKEDVHFEATNKDSERCLYLINKYLIDAGYPSLYYGNPYDWIFMWALCDKNPLWAFRTYILEVMIANKES